MVIRPDDKKNIFISGIFIVCLSIIMLICVFLLTKESSLLESKLIILTTVKNARNLKAGSAVQLKGIKIGTVKSVTFKNINTLTISMEIIEKFKTWIKKDSHISFKTQGVLGDRFMEILGGSEDAETIADGDYLVTKEGTQIDNFINKGEDILVVASRVLQKVDAIFSNIESKRLNNILSNIDKTTFETNKFFHQLNSNNIAKNLSASTKALSKIGERIQNGPGTMHSLIYDRSVHDDIKSVLGGTKRNKILKYFIREAIKEKR